jgi:replication factor A1
MEKTSSYAIIPIYSTAVEYLSEIFQEEVSYPILRLTLLFQDSLAKNLEEKTLNHKEPIIIEHLAFLSVKYNVYLSELYRALVSARVIGKSVCEDLTVEYRGVINDQAVFLITKANIVVVQFRVAEEFLLRKNISFESWLDTDKIHKQVAKKNLARDLTLIQNLRHGMKKVNLRAEVLETQKPQLIHTQFGNSVMLTNAWITDETGKVKLCLWGEQANSPVVGDIVQIKHASVRTFKGERQLSLGKFGTLSILQSNADRVEQQHTINSQNTVYA